LRVYWFFSLFLPNKQLSQLNTMQTNSNLLNAIILAVGIVILGLCLKSGIDNFANKDRRVTVKGLAEREVEADKVTWPIVSKEIGNSLPDLYSQIAEKNKRIKTFLTQNGIQEKEITEQAPQVIDLNADRWNSNKNAYRYNITSTLTVTSRNVAKVRELIARQGEMLKEGVAIVAGEYDNPVVYEYVSFKEMKPQMMTEAIENAQKTAEQFAKNSGSKLNKIISADQGQFSIDNRDEHTPHIKKLRVVTTITYSLKN